MKGAERMKALKLAEAICFLAGSFVCAQEGRLMQA